MSEEVKFLYAVGFSREEIYAMWRLQVGEDLLYFHAPNNSTLRWKTYRKEPALVLTRLRLELSQADIHCPDEEFVENWVAWSDGSEFTPFAIKTTTGKILFCDFHHNARTNFKAEFLQAMDALMGTSYFAKYLIDEAVKYSVKIEKIVFVEDKEALVEQFQKQLTHQNKLMLDQLQVIREYYHDRLRELQLQIEQERQEALIEGIAIGSSLEGWKYEYGNFVYTKKIYVEKIVKGRFTRDIRTTKLYVKGLWVARDAETKKWRAYAEDSVHPNIDSATGKVCLGDLANAPLPELLQRLPDLLKIANLDSAYSNRGEEIADRLWHEAKEADEESGEDSRMEVFRTD